MRKIIVKEGPLVFIRDVFLMELVAAAFFFALSFITNYEQLFNEWGILRYIRYNDLLIITFSLFQLFYVTLLFLHWYFSHYELNEREITKKSGLLWRSRKSTSLADVTSVEIKQSPLSRMMHHATIILTHRDGRITNIKNVGNFQEYDHIIKQFVREAGGSAFLPNVGELIGKGESHSLEFKETLRYDVRKGETSKEMEHAVLKTVTSFMNTEGGTLLIGVDDAGEVKGLESDYKALPKKNRDGFENHLSMLIKTTIGLPFAKYLSVRFEQMEGKDLCVVMVRPAHKPAYLRTADRREEFYVRVGNSTQPFTMSEAEEYIQGRWK